MKITLLENAFMPTNLRYKYIHMYIHNINMYKYYIVCNLGVCALDTFDLMQNHEITRNSNAPENSIINVGENLPFHFIYCCPFKL